MSVDAEKPAGVLATADCPTTVAAAAVDKDTAGAGATKPTAGQAAGMQAAALSVARPKVSPPLPAPQPEPSPASPRPAALQVTLEELLREAGVGTVQPQVLQVGTGLPHRPQRNVSPAHLLPNTQMFGA
jgi:hypothetical protein